MKTTKQTFKYDGFTEITVNHSPSEVSDMRYKLEVKEGDKTIILSMDMVKSILKVCRRNLKEVSR